MQCGGLQAKGKDFGNHTGVASSYLLLRQRVGFCDCATSSGLAHQSKYIWDQFDESNHVVFWERAPVAVAICVVVRFAFFVGPRRGYIVTSFPFARPTTRCQASGTGAFVFARNSSLWIGDG